MVDVGIVMPVYHQRFDFLNTAIRSILTQSYRMFRMVIVVDGAPEMTPLIRQSVNGDSRVEIIDSPVNQGVAGALNLGFERLAEDTAMTYLTWVSSDNIYDPAFIAIMRRKLMDSNDNVGLVYSSFRTIDNNGTQLSGEKELAALRQFQAQPKEALLHSSITGVSFMYKASYARKIAGYRMPPVEDYDYWLRLTEHCEMKYVPVELMDYRVNSEYSVSASLKSVEKQRTWRYYYHLARYEARCRRGIQPQVTVLLLAERVDQRIIERIENLYDQKFSNYIVLFVDRSIDGKASEDIGVIPHPVVSFLKYPSIPEQQATYEALRQVKTPYTLVLGERLFIHATDLMTLVHELGAAQPELFSNYYTESRLIGYRRYAAEERPYHNELFRTQKLLSLFEELFLA